MATMYSLPVACLLTAALLCLPAQALGQQQNTQALKQEESLDYYQKWLNEDVVYLISDDERAVFAKLTTEEEKEQFIEQFWYRRDPDPKTATNEFKDEHYRRIAYANEWFTSATPGWKTDRGRIYVIHGPPDGIERHAAGGPYVRPAEEGGGATTTYPFEKWWYRNMASLGAVELEFVDPSSTGEYRLALNPFEKDAMKYIPGAGLTESELRGDTTKADRPYYFPGNYANRGNYLTGSENDPFRQWEKFVVAQKPVPVKYADLKEVVGVNVSYADLPFRIRADYLKLNDEQVLVPITVQVDNRQLTYKEDGDRRVAKVAFYGIITSITNRVVAEFDDDMETVLATDKFEQGVKSASLYQRILPLDTKTRYKLDFVVKDLNSGKIGVVRQALVPPPVGGDKLFSSSLLLADVIMPVGDPLLGNQMFVLGDVKVRPSVTRTFASRNSIGIYLQVYNAAFDQATNAPSLRIVCRLLQDGSVLSEIVEDSGQSIQYFSEQRVVIIRGLPTKDLRPGKYRLRVEVTDRIADKAVTVADDFEVVSAN